MSSDMNHIPTPLLSETLSMWPRSIMRLKAYGWCTRRPLSQADAWRSVEGDSGCLRGRGVITGEEHKHCGSPVVIVLVIKDLSLLFKKEGGKKKEKDILQINSVAFSFSRLKMS